MPIQHLASDVLDDEFLQIRHRLIDIAAALDRIDRGTDPAKVQADPRLAEIQRAVDVLSETKPNRAERLQMVFSQEYSQPLVGSG